MLSVNHFTVVNGHSILSSPPCNEGGTGTMVILPQPYSTWVPMDYLVSVLARVDDKIRPGGFVDTQWDLPARVPRDMLTCSESCKPLYLYLYPHPSLGPVKCTNKPSSLS